MWILYSFASALFAGVTAILAKVGMKDTDSTVATAIRTIVVLFFSWSIVGLTGSWSSINEIRSTSLFFLICSGISTGISWIFYFKALSLGDVNKVAPMDKSSTIMTMMLAFLFLDELVSLTMIFGLLLIGLGTFFMVSKSKGEKERDEIQRKGKRRYEKKWMIYGWISALSASLTAILGKAGIEGVESNLGTAIRTTVVLIMAWIVVFLMKKQGEVRLIDKRGWIFLCLSGMTTGLSWLCYYKALQDGLVSVVVPVDKLSILITVAFSYFVLREKLGRKALVGLIILTAGTLILLIK